MPAAGSACKLAAVQALQCVEHYCAWHIRAAAALSCLQLPAVVQLQAAMCAMVEQ